MNNKNKKRSPSFWKWWGKARSYSPEIMDDISKQDERLEQALIELKIINKFLGGNAVTKKGIRYLDKKLSKDLKILDTGGGTSDTLLNLNKHSNIFNLDINMGACIIAKRYSPELKVVCGDSKRLPFREGAIDIVHTSLFLHHFNEVEIKQMIIEFLKIARYGIVINDLRRSVLAYTGIKVLTTLFSKSDMVKNDGPLSVKRGFIKSDLLNILNDLNINSFLIKRKWAFRWLVIIYKNGK